MSVFLFLLYLHADDSPRSVGAQRTGRGGCAPLLLNVRECSFACVNFLFIRAGKGRTSRGITEFPQFSCRVARQRQWRADFDEIFWKKKSAAKKNPPKKPKQRQTLQRDCRTRLKRLRSENLESAIERFLFYFLNDYYLFIRQMLIKYWRSFSYNSMISY